jgi:hypothetical protein
MSLSPDKIAFPIDMLNGNGTATGTQSGPVQGFPPGKKAVQISVVTSATLTAKIQNSIDKTNWFDVVASTNTSILAEVESVVPFWRANITVHTTSGTGAAAPIVIQMAQLLN